MECRELYFEEFDAALEFLAKFHAQLPIFKELGLDENNFRNYFKPYLEEALNKEFALGIFDNEKIVAVAIAEDNFNKNHKFPDNQKILKKLQYHSLLMKKAYDNPVMDVLAEDKLKLFHLSFLAFDEETITVATLAELFSEYLDITEKTAFNYLLVDCYSHEIKASLQSLNFIRVNSFSLNKQTGFKDLDEDEKLEVWLREI